MTHASKFSTISALAIWIREAPTAPDPKGGDE
jgi:hypothetical protein